MPETIIRLPQPCAESWAAMTPTATGRHCGTCQENVVDFTRMTEAEVVIFLRRYPSVSCGRFRESQLDRPLLAPAQAVRGWRRWWGTTLALLGMAALNGPKAQGQTVSSEYWGGPVPGAAVGQPGLPIPVPTPPLQPRPVAAPVSAPPTDREMATTTDSLVIRGVVHNRLGFRRAGARVRLHGGNGHTITDEKGRFELVVARKDLTEYSQLCALAWYENDHDHYLKAEIPVVPSKTDTYVVRLKRHERIRGGKFR